MIYFAWQFFLYWPKCQVSSYHKSMTTNEWINFSDKIFAVFLFFLFFFGFQAKNRWVLLLRERQPAKMSLNGRKMLSSWLCYHDNVNSKFTNTLKILENVWKTFLNTLLITGWEKNVRENFSWIHNSFNFFTIRRFNIQ